VYPGYGRTWLLLQLYAMPEHHRPGEDQIILLGVIGTLYEQLNDLPRLVKNVRLDQVRCAGAHPHLFTTLFKLCQLLA